MLLHMLNQRCQMRIKQINNLLREHSNKQMVIAIYQLVIKGLFIKQIIGLSWGILINLVISSLMRSIMNTKTSQFTLIKHSRMRWKKESRQSNLHANHWLLRRLFLQSQLFYNQSSHLTLFSKEVQKKRH